MNKRTKEECITWLTEHGLSTSGTLQELKMRINKFNLYPSLAKKLKVKNEKNFIFATSLNPLEIPPITTGWSSNYDFLPKVTATVFKDYASKKREGSMGQQQKAYSMLTSRKIVPVKCYTETVGKKFVKGQIKKSYGEHIRPTTILFQNSVPLKAYCECPVGVSGLCCHTLALLLFLKHYTETQEKLLALSCTEQLQKWHKRTRKGSLPMIPLRQLKVKSARSRKKFVHNEKIVPADPDKSKMKRNVLDMKAEVSKKLATFPLSESFENHCFNVLGKYDAGIKSSLMSHLEYKFSKLTANSLADHDYCKENESFNSDIITIPPSKIYGIKNSIKSNLQEKINIISQSTNRSSSNNLALNTQIKEQLDNNIFTLNLQSQLPLNPNSKSNYHNVAQNTPEWQNLRQKKVTGSRLPALIGIHGKNKFDSYWSIVTEGLAESDIFKNDFVNFKRGHQFEDTALLHFNNEAKCNAIKCGFFSYSDNHLFGASPDGLVGPDLLIEVKTRAAGSTTPLCDLNKNPSYFLQTQLQMLCTDTHYCLLMSYHPESIKANYFLIQRDDIVLSMVKIVINSIYNKAPILEWPHKENIALRNIEKHIIGKIPNFESLKSIRSYINKCSKNATPVKFC